MRLVFFKQDRQMGSFCKYSFLMSVIAWHLSLIPNSAGNSKQSRFLHFFTRSFTERITPDQAVVLSPQ